jgi:uncharacterized protein (TIGR02266 family)
MADTRKDKRAPLSLKVRFKSATVDDFVEQYSIDISRGGTFIKSKKPMAVGTLLKFEFQLKDESRLIHGVGRVVWKRDPENADADNPAGMGVKFIKMDPESRALVQQIVDKRGDQPGQFEAGQADQRTQKTTAEGEVEAAKEGEASMFPSTSAPADLPPPEDRTAVRHASEFLAEALAGTDEAAAAEARAGADAARKRTEELERERLQQGKAEEGGAEARRASEPASTSGSPVAAEASKGETPASGGPSTGAQPDAATAAHAATAAEAGTAADASSEGASVEGESEPAHGSAPAQQRAGAATPPATRAPSESSRSSEKKDDKAAAGAKPRLPAEPAEGRSSAEPERSSRAVPVLVAIVVLAGVGLFVAQRQGFFAGGEGASEEELEAEASGPAVAGREVEPGIAEADADAAVATAMGAGDGGPKGDGGAAASTTTVPVRSKPPGATIAVNGEPKGEAPLEVTLPVGREVTVRATHAGYAPLERTLRASEPAEPLELELERMRYVLEVATLPAGARVRAGGETVTAPAEIDVGNRPRALRVVAVMPGYRRAGARVTPDDFEAEDGVMRHRVNLRLRKRSGGRPEKAESDDKSASEAEPGTSGSSAEGGSSAEDSPAAADAEDAPNEEPSQAEGQDSPSSEGPADEPPAEEPTAEPEPAEPEPEAPPEPSPEPAPEGGEAGSTSP